MSAPRKRTKRWVTVVALAFALAGCGTSQGPTVPTAQHSATAPAASPGSVTPSTQAKDSDYDKALRYTRCMTANGAVTPDPVEGEPLVTANYITKGDNIELYKTKRAAHEKCKQFLPASWPIKSDPKDYARSKPFFDCMRQHGQPEPEPDANGMVHQSTDETWRSTPEYEAALKVCRHLYDDPANDQPENK